jgi:hypothetical protein
MMYIVLIASAMEAPHPFRGSVQFCIGKRILSPLQHIPITKTYLGQRSEIVVPICILPIRTIRGTENVAYVRKILLIGGGYTEERRLNVPRGRIKGATEREGSDE